MTPDPFFPLAIALIGCILILILVSLRARRERIPWKGIRYDDMDPTRRPGKTYYDPETGLTGKPDWIIDSWRGPCPPEPSRPRWRDRRPAPARPPVGAAACPGAADGPWRATGP